MKQLLTEDFNIETRINESCFSIKEILKNLSPGWSAYLHLEGKKKASRTQGRLCYLTVQRLLIFCYLLRRVLHLLRPGACVKDQDFMLSSVTYSENKDCGYSALSFAYVSPSRQWAMHLRRSAQRLKHNLNTDGIKLCLWVLQSCIIQSYSQYFFTLSPTPDLEICLRFLMKKSHKRNCTWTSTETHIVQHHPEVERK